MSILYLLNHIGSFWGKGVNSRSDDDMTFLGDTLFTAKREPMLSHALILQQFSERSLVSANLRRYFRVRFPPSQSDSCPQRLAARKDALLVFQDTLDDLGDTAIHSSFR